MPNPFGQNPFFSMLGQMPQFGPMQGQQPQFGQPQMGGQPQGPFGAARWLPGFLGQQGGQQGGLMGGLAPWSYEVPTPEYIASFLASQPSVPQRPAQAPLTPRQGGNRAGPGPDRDRSGLGGRAADRGGRSGRSGADRAGRGGDPNQSGPR